MAEIIKSGRDSDSDAYRPGQVDDSRLLSPHKTTFEDSEMPAKGSNVARNPYLLLAVTDDAVGGANPNLRVRGTARPDLLRLDRNMLTIRKLRISSRSFAVRSG